MTPAAANAVKSRGDQNYKEVFMKKAKWILWEAGGILLLGVIAYFGISYYIFDLFTTVHPQCGSEYMDGWREFTPANFRGEYYDGHNVDAEKYLMPDFKTVEFPARADGNTISAWFVSANVPSDKAVIVVHGGDMCRQSPSVLLPAGMLANNGFNVLIIDLRNHGASQIVNGRFAAGATEYKDVLGAFDWLRGQGYAAGRIGVLGVSLGGATSINAFGEEPQIAALWEDSAFADVPTVLDDQLTMNGLPLFFADGVLLVARFNGARLDTVSTLASIQKLNGRPMMIVHGTEDEWVNVRSAYRLHEAAGDAAGLWIIAGTKHVDGMFAYPDEYEQRLVAFFENSLGK